MNKNILFVDDEPRILEGLEHMLYGMRRDWSMRFARGGTEALTLLEQEPADVVVSDMRMPEMGGVELLGQIMELYPSTVRIILSGQSDHAEIMRSVGSTHQFLSKPCTAEVLKSTIARACALRDLLSSGGLKNLVTSMTRLPSLPSLYMEVMEELKSPNSSINGIGAIIARDIGMTAKILQLVNSSFFGLRRHISTAADAVRMLGLDTVKALVLSAGIFDQFDSDDISALELESLWSHSLSTGVMAQAIARAEGADRTLADEALLAGCLHDIGKVILATNFKGQYTSLVRQAAALQKPLCELELEALGATHGRIGAYLLGLWGLNDSIVEAVAFHDMPCQSEGESFAPLTAVHVANAIDHARGISDVDLQIHRGYLALIDLEERLPRWRAAAEQIGQEKT